MTELDVINLTKITLERIFIKKENLLFFRDMLSDLSFREFLGNIPLHENQGDGIFNSDFVVKKLDTEEKIGFVSIANQIDRNGLLATSLYYGVHPIFRVQHWGRAIIDEVSSYLLKQKFVHVVIANVDRNNYHSLQVMNDCHFVFHPEFSDEDELQFHRK